MISDEDIGSPRSQTPDEMILVTSSGDSADYQGQLFGLYQQMETQFNNASVYKQLHNVTGTQGFLIYLGDDGVWHASNELGASNGNLRNNMSASLPPRSGWWYWDGEKYESDSELGIETVSNISSLICPSVTITASGEAARFRTQYLGEFKPTSQFSAGRPIFINSHNRFLLVGPYTIPWGVADDVETTTGALISGSAPDMNPASVRSKYNYYFNWTSWQYADGNGWQDGDIQVACNDQNSSF